MEANFHMSFETQKPTQAAFEAIKQVSKWWTQHLEGSSANEGDEFSVRFGDVHYSKHRLVEVIPNRKIVWLTTESNLSFVRNPEEWTGSKVIFDISSDGEKTKVSFTHEGLTPKIECYEACSNAWPEYVEKLKMLIESE